MKVFQFSSFGILGILIVFFSNQILGGSVNEQPYMKEIDRMPTICSYFFANSNLQRIDSNYVISVNSLEAGTTYTCNLSTIDDPLLCGWGNGLTKTVYSDTPNIQIGTRLYYDVNLSQPVTGYNYIRFYSSYYPNNVFHIQLDGTFNGAQAHGCY